MFFRSTKTETEHSDNKTNRQHTQVSSADRLRPESANSSMSNKQAKQYFESLVVILLVFLIVDVLTILVYIELSPLTGTELQNILIVAVVMLSATVIILVTLVKHIRKYFWNDPVTRLF